MTTPSEPTTSSSGLPAAVDPLQLLLKQPLTVQIEQYVSSALLIISFLLTNFHVGFHLPAVTQSTIDAVSVLGFVAVNGYVWIDKRLRHAKAATLSVVAGAPSTTSSAATPSQAWATPSQGQLKAALFDRTV